MKRHYVLILVSVLLLISPIFGAGHTSSPQLEVDVISTPTQLDGIIQQGEYGLTPVFELELTPYDKYLIPLTERPLLKISMWAAYDDAYFYLGATIPDPTKTTEACCDDSFGITFDQGTDGGTRDFQLTDGSEDGMSVSAAGQPRSGYWYGDDMENDRDLSKLQGIMKYRDQVWHVEIATPFGAQNLRNMNPGNIIGFCLWIVENGADIIYVYPSTVIQKPLNPQNWPGMVFHSSESIESRDTSETAAFVSGWEWVGVVGALCLGTFLVTKRKT